MNKLQTINEEINRELTTETAQALLQTTFKGLTQASMKQAMVEGGLRGFKFKDFLEKNVYAIPFKDGYSLVTSIDYARKVGMRSGVVGVSAPTYEENAEGKIISCTVTVKRKVENTVGEYSATVYFDEYYKSNQYKTSLWDTKPRTMIAKVAEMHALRKACPEELAQAYTEEEMVKEAVIEVVQEIPEEVKVKVENAKTEEELKAIWDEHKGLGKGFAKLVVTKKALIKESLTTENEKTSSRAR